MNIKTQEIHNKTIDILQTAMSDKTLSSFSPVLSHIRQIMIKAEFNDYFIDIIIRNVAKGNYDAVYLDDRVVADNPKRIKAKKQLEEIRSWLFKCKAKNISSLDILLQPI